MAVHEAKILLLANYFLVIYASYHWKITGTGRISSQVENSGFPLARQDDLLVLLEQEERLKTVGKLYKELISLKKSIDGQWNKIERDGDIEKRLYSSDIDCLIGEIPLSQHNLNTEFLDYGQGSRPKMKTTFEPGKPDCTAYSELDFSMRTFPHLETLSQKKNLSLTLNHVPSRNIIDFNIDAMLKLNGSDWTAYNIASYYWRTVGNGTNALECAKRALYFSPRSKRYIVLLNLGTLLQELESLGEAAIVLHSAVDHDPVQDVSHLALGNVYAALGDYKRSLACYENVLSLNPRNIRALQLKHALLCHKKLESGLLEIHSFLEKLLRDLQRHNALYEEWMHLQNQVNWVRNSKVREFFSLSQPIYVNLQMLLQNVEHQAKTLNEEVSKRVPMKGGWSEGDLRTSENSVRSCGKSEALSKEGETEDVGPESFVAAEYLLKNKMNSIVTFPKSSYGDQINMLGVKKKMEEDLNFLDGKTFFSLNRPFLFGNVDDCIDDSGDVKKLN